MKDAEKEAASAHEQVKETEEYLRRVEKTHDLKHAGSHSFLALSAKQSSLPTGATAMKTYAGVLIISGDAPWDDVMQQRAPGAKREIVSMY